MPKAPDQPTRALILHAAVEEIAEKGWGGVRTRSIAQRAGVNGALVHYHFGSMEDLLIEAVASTFALFTDPAQESIEAEDFTTGMEGMLEMIGRIDPADPRWQVLMEAFLQVHRVPRLGDLTKALLEQYRHAIEQRLDQAARVGELPEDADTEGVSLGVMALLDGLALYAYVNPEYDTHRAGRAVLSLLTTGGRST